MNDTNETKFAVREAAFVLGCSTFVIYSHFKGKIDGGLTAEQLDEIQAHLAKKGVKPYRYKTAELEKVRLYIGSKPDAQQRMEYR